MKSFLNTSVQKKPEENMKGEQKKNPKNKKDQLENKQ